MNKNLKFLSIKCDWNTFNNNVDASGNNKNFWKGHLIFNELENGFCYGVVTDADKTDCNLKYTHLVIGTLVEDKGISVVKVSMERGYDPIDFSLVADNENKNYAGNFSALTYFDCVPLGNATLTLEQEQLSEQEKQDIMQNADNYIKAVLERTGMEQSKRYVQAIIEGKSSNMTVSLIEELYNKKYGITNSSNCEVKEYNDAFSISDDEYTPSDEDEFANFDEEDVLPF